MESFEQLKSNSTDSIHETTIPEHESGSKTWTGWMTEKQLRTISESEAEAFNLLEANGNTEVSNIIGEIDYETLQSLFNGELSKSGVEEERMILGREAVKYGDTDKVAYFAREDDSVVISVPSLIKMTISSALEFKDSRELTYELLIDELRREALAMMCHEESHVVSFSKECAHSGPVGSWFESLFSKKVLEIEKAGYLSLEYEKGKEHYVNSLLDEAITDTIGGEIYEQYLEQTGSAQDHNEMSTNIAYPYVYAAGARLNDLFCHMIAEESGVAITAVWEGIKKGYFDGEDFTEAGMKELFGEMLSEDVIREIRTIDDDDAEKISALSKKMRREYEERKSTQNQFQSGNED